MSLIKNNSLAVSLVAAVAFSVAAIQGCSSDNQATPASGGAGSGAGGASHAGTAGKSNSAGTAGKSMMNEGGSAGQEPDVGGMGGDTSMGGEGGAPPSPSCDLSFDNSTLTAITDNGGVLPDLP